MKPRTFLITLFVPDEMPTREAVKRVVKASPGIGATVTTVLTPIRVMHQAGYSSLLYQESDSYYVPETTHVQSPAEAVEPTP